MVKISKHRRETFGAFVLNGEGERKGEKERKKQLTMGDSSAIVSKLSVASGRASVGGGKKVLKSTKKALDKTKMVWYSNQAVCAGCETGRMRALKKVSEETKKVLDKRSRIC